MHRTDTALRSGPHELAVVGLVVCLLTLCDPAPHAQLAVPGPSGVVGPGPTPREFWFHHDLSPIRYSYSASTFSSAGTTLSIL